jgi:hypothetical protein
MLTRVWDDCKTKEQKEQFKKEMDEIDKHAVYRPFNDWMFENLMEELS